MILSYEKDLLGSIGYGESHAESYISLLLVLKGVMSFVKDL